MVINNSKCESYTGSSGEHKSLPSKVGWSVVAFLGSGSRSALIGANHDLRCTWALINLSRIGIACTGRVRASCLVKKCARETETRPVNILHPVGQILGTGLIDAGMSLSRMDVRNSFVNTPTVRSDSTQLIFLEQWLGLSHLTVVDGR
jgi:hypothetical protein